MDQETPASGGDVSGQGPSQSVPNLTFLQVKSNEVLDQEAKLAEQAKQLTESIPIKGALQQYIESLYQESVNAKQGITDKMMESLRRREGEYSAEHLAEIKKQGGTDIFMKITEIFCNSAEAIISDVALPDNDRPWKVAPSRKPALPPQVIQEITDRTMEQYGNLEGVTVPDTDIVKFVRELKEAKEKEIMQEAVRRADNMSSTIEDELDDGGYDEATDQCIEDLVTFGVGIMKGPTIEVERTLQWLSDDDYTPEVTDIPKMKFKCVSPLKFFPSPGATSIENATYMIEVDEFTRRALKAMIGRPGWNAEAINRVITENQAGTTVHVRTNAEEKTVAGGTAQAIDDNPDKKFQGMWLTGTCAGWRLSDWGMEGLDITQDYEVVALSVGSEVLHARLNSDPLGARSYSKAVYKPIKGSFWGRGIPLLMDDTQDTCNATARALINNLAIGSGPQAVINDASRLAEGENIQSMYPWKIWQFNDPTHSGSRAMDFYQPSVNSEMLIRVFDRFIKLAEDRTGIPSYAWGSGQTGPGGGTATSLSMLMNSANRLMKKSFKYIDLYLIRPLITRVYRWNMLYLDDPEIKGDCSIVASGVMALLVKEQRQLRLNEALNLTNNPVDLAIIGQKGRAKLLRESFRNMNAPDIIPDDKELEARMAKEQAAAQAQALAASAQAEPMPPGQGAPVGEPVMTQ